jgi:hypothetical protein
MGLNGKVDANGYAARPGKGLYQPSPQFDSRRGARITSVLVTKGEYLVFMAGSQGPGGPESGNVQVTAVSSGYRHCFPSFWENTFTPFLDVSCFDNAGRFANTKFTLQWVDIKP